MTSVAVNEALNNIEQDIKDLLMDMPETTEADRVHADATSRTLGFVHNGIGYSLMVNVTE